MRSKAVRVWCLCVLVGGFACSGFAAEQHPRLFLGGGKIEAIKKAVAVGGSHHAEAFGALKGWVDEKWRVPYDPASGNWNYERAYMARGAAMVYAVTGEKKYAELAYQVLKDVHDKPDRDKRLPDVVKTYGLAKATVGEGFATAYDWCYGAWSDEQRKYVKDVIVRSLDNWPKYSHSQLQVDRGSNWAAVCRGAELVMLLASYEDENRPDRLKYLRSQLQRHMAITYGPGGLSQEGIGYTGYGGIYLLEACYALADVGDDTLVKELGRHSFWKLLMFAGSSLVTDSWQRRFIQQGVSGTAINDEGWASLVLNSVPTDQLPCYVWFYDRHMGKLAPGEPSQKYDNNRSAWVWSLIYYPTDVDGKNPADVVGLSHFDKKAGGYFFRNRWKDENDIICAVFADLANHKAWDQREATGIRLIGHGSAFFGGPSKSKGAELFTRVLVDGKSEGGKNSGKNGKAILSESTDTGGYVIVGGGATYKDMGVDDLTRHVTINFSVGENAVIISTLDRIKSGADHTYTWNANLGSDKGDDGIKASAGKEAGRATFLLEGRNGWVKGWVMQPADAKVNAGDPLQIVTKGADVDIWVVMLTGSGNVPTGKISGQGLGGRLQVGGTVVGYDSSKDRITVEK